MNTARAPAWRVLVDGRDLTERFRPRLLELTLTEARGKEADQLDLKIHDHDGALDLPQRGAEISVALGWAASGLIEKGRFKVDECGHSGPPDIVTVRARSADLTHQLRNRRARSWHATTLGQILQTLAGEHGLQARIAPELARIDIAHIDQTNESDVHFLTRLGDRFDAMATVKAGALLFSPIGAGVTTSGLQLPGVSLKRSDGDSHDWSEADRDRYDGVSAQWDDGAGARKRTVTSGGNGNAKRLKRTYGSEKEAREHADAEWNRVQRGGAKLTLNLAHGRADIYPEQPVRVQGFKPEMDATEWLVERAVHTVTGAQGFRTQLEMEARVRR